jgi:hypothetical protein
MSAGVGWGYLRGESEDAAATVAPAPKRVGVYRPVRSVISMPLSA